MTKAVRTAIAAAAFTAVGLLPAEAEGQRRTRGDFPERHVTVEIFAGVADFGRFLEEYVFDDDDDDTFFDLLGEREITAKTALAIGAAVGARIWERTEVRLGFTFSPTELEFKDDTGFDLDRLDRDDVADLNVFVLSLDVIRYLLDPTRRLTPYASAGLTANWCNLGDDGSDEIVAVDETQFRWGGFGSIGAYYRINRRLGAKLEIATMALGNPFDGDNAYVSVDGIKFDEPSSVRMSRITLMLTYSTLKDR